jgi:hypothetical protein
METLMPTQHPTTPAHGHGRDRFMLVTLGFTQSDRARDYSSFTDGYRLGARQVAVTITVEAAGIDLTGEQWAEAVFVASNDPHPLTDPATPVDRAVAAIRHALATQVRFAVRTFSVGDTVTAGGVVLACQPVGWQPVTDLPHPDEDPTGDPDATGLEQR